MGSLIRYIRLLYFADSTPSSGQNSTWPIFELTILGQLEALAEYVFFAVSLISVVSEWLHILTLTRASFPQGQPVAK